MNFLVYSAVLQKYDTKYCTVHLVHTAHQPGKPSSCQWSTRPGSEHAWTNDHAIDWDGAKILQRVNLKGGASLSSTHHARTNAQGT